MANILIINGPNLNLLGTRETGTYGIATLEQIEAQCHKKAVALNLDCTCFQSNAEHSIIERIHTAATENVHVIIINPAAFTHTSVAIRDALLGVAIPFIEVHLSNIHAREPFRHHSYFSDKAKAVLCGCGALGYNLALDLAADMLGNGP